MALLGENAQCMDNFPRYYSTRELIFDFEGSTWISSKVNNELRTDSYHMGPFPLSSTCTLFGCNRELVKRTILKHEAIFKDQIHELHRVYHKQRELMDEIKRSELHKHNVRLEASWSSSALSSKNAENIFCSPNLPWSTSQSSVLFAECIQLPLTFPQEKSRQVCPPRASTVTDESVKHYILSESKCRKIGNKILDLQLPAYEYIDSDEGEENEMVTQVPKDSAYSLNGVSQVLRDTHDKPDINSSSSFANLNVPFKLDLNVPFRLEEVTTAKSCDMEAPTHHMNNGLFDLSMRTKFDSHNLRNDVIDKRKDIEGCSHNHLPDNEKKRERLSGGLLDSFAKGIHIEKKSVSVDSLSRNMDQLDDLPCFHSLHQINRVPWTERKISSSESSARTQCPRSNGLLGAMGLPCLKESKSSCPIEESNLGTEKTLVFPSNKSCCISSNVHSFHDFASKYFKNQSKNQRIEEIEKSCVLDVKSPSTDVSDLGEQIPTSENSNKNEKKKHEYLARIIDLNSSMIEDENMSNDVDLHAPASPENKECSPPRGESDENQLVTPFQSAEPEDPHGKEEQTRIAAEALVSISGFVAKKDIQTTTCSSSESFVNSPLHWFAGIVSTTVVHRENDNATDSNGKVNNLEEFLLDEIDYFEFMTLNLSETKDLDCRSDQLHQLKQIGGSTSPTQARKSVRTNKGRWRKDFQSEILPSLASLSRYEVTEDLKTIGGLITTGTHSKMGSLRNASRNIPSRERRRSCTSNSNTKDTDLLLNLKQLTSISKFGIEKKGLLSWGKTCKKRRGPRYRITNPQFIWS